MNLRMANIKFGFVTLLITAVVGGMMLGGTFNEYSIKEGNHLLGIARFYLREGHSHGNFMAIFNILIGLVLNNLTLSEKAKKWCSYSAMASVLLPLGLFVKGAMNASDDAPPFGLIGILGVLVAIVIIIYGAFKTKAS